MVDARLGRFVAMRPQSDMDIAATLFVKELEQFWATTKTLLRADFEAMGLNFDIELPTEARCLSPSDFGFHNALVRPSGSLCFIDFEYAGWDDPAKTVCDFFCQPAVPVPHCYLGSFVDQVADWVPDAADFRHRVGILLPVYEVKWCCIMLNEFLPVGNRRRSFARSEEDFVQRQEMQLDKVEAAVSRLEKSF
jgi:hypothetical protein